jgi:hypothetical protein
MRAARARRSSGKKGNKKEMGGLQKKRGLRIKRPAANTKKKYTKKNTAKPQHSSGSTTERSSCRSAQAKKKLKKKLETYGCYEALRQSAYFEALMHTVLLMYADVC